ncbi:MAG: FAD-dependent thymidylate synthase [Candidatus Paceibacteria bacterium]
MEIKLSAHTNVNPLDLTSYAAKICYTSELPEWGKRLNVEKALFNTGHHTTLEHFYLTYVIDGIAVGDITFGMHLAHPFYNTDQRSGRYAGKMFADPDFEGMETYIREFWPGICPSTFKELMDYIKSGADVYSTYMPDAQEIVTEFIKKDRPYASDGIRANIPKYAQEQMRMFIPVIFPTAFAFTIDIITLVSMYESAWTPPMRYITEEMARLFVKKFPDIEFLFNKSRRRKTNWAMSCDFDEIDVRYKPNLHVYKRSKIDDGYIKLPAELVHPVDKLHFTPETMCNSVNSIKMEIEISTATMGQDQRHRTIYRGTPQFTGNFYVPPALKGLGLTNEAIRHMHRWKNISELIPGTLAMILAPYGTMVSYEKSGSLNAIAHEQCKRLCWCAQEEIYHLGRLQRIAIEEESDNDLLSIFQPSCYETGKCGEGDRYCGRDIKLRKEEEKYFPERRI